MNCPFCGRGLTRVIDSRDAEGEDAVRRRRECLECGQRFTTFEKVDEIPITVVKRDGRSEAFRHDKILQGLVRACTKRDVSLSQLESIVTRIERELRDEMTYSVTSERIGKMVLERLEDVDLVAYVRFASVYRQYESVEEFKEELAHLAEEGKLAKEGIR